MLKKYMFYHHEIILFEEELPPDKPPSVKQTVEVFLVLIDFILLHFIALTQSLSFLLSNRPTT